MANVQIWSDCEDVFIKNKIYSPESSAIHDQKTWHVVKFSI